MVTPDLRFPQGADRAAQNADFQISSCQGASQTCKRYFVNRNPGGDQSVGAGWGFSNYDFVRFHSWRTSGATGSAQNGDLPFFTKAENDLMAAEGYIRRGNPAAAVTIVNATRTVAGLAPIVAGNGVIGPTGNGAPNCAADGVPRVPSGSGATAT